MLSWYVARVLHGQEYAAAWKVNHFDPPLVRAFCPMERRRWTRFGKEHERLMPVLSGYIFVEMYSGDPVRWHEVADQKGFYGFVGGAAPTPVRARRVEELLERATADWLMELTPLREVADRFRRGDRVRLCEGVLDNCLGQIEWTRSREDGPVAQVTVTEGFFGFPMRVEVPFEFIQLVKAPSQPHERKTLLDLPVVSASALQVQ